MQLLGAPNDETQALAAGICRNLSISQETEAELVEAGVLVPMIALLASPNPGAYEHAVNCLKNLSSSAAHKVCRAHATTSLPEAALRYASQCLTLYI